MSPAFERQKFKPTGLEDTTISVWMERDRAHICLSRKSDDKTLVEWRDENVGEAIDDGFLDASEAVLGNLERHARQGGALHRSAFTYWVNCVK